MEKQVKATKETELATKNVKSRMLDHSPDHSRDANDRCTEQIYPPERGSNTALALPATISQRDRRRNEGTTFLPLSFDQVRLVWIRSRSRSHETACLHREAMLNCDCRSSWAKKGIFDEVKEGKTLSKGCLRFRRFCEVEAPDSTLPELR